MNINVGGAFLADTLKHRMADILSRGDQRVVEKKTQDNWRVEAEVVKYDVPSHTALVRVKSRAGGGGRPIRVTIAEKFQGKTPGSGEAHALYKGQLVDVEFGGGSATGLYNQGTVVGTRYTPADQGPPMWAPRMQSKGGGITRVMSGKGEVTDAMFADGKTTSKFKKAPESNDLHNTEMTTVTGSNKPFTEEKTQQAASGIGKAAKLL